MRPRLHTNNFVVNSWAEYIRNEAGANTLNLCGLPFAGGQYRGGIRLNSNYLDIRIPILQGTCRRHGRLSVPTPATKMSTL